jgi:hypothetical protein
MTRAWAGLAALLSAAPILAASAEPPRLEFPLNCTLGLDCFVQQYVDRDPGPAGQDYACGHLTASNHKGVDIAVPDLAAMRRGVAVLAAASGRVRGTRDGMPDQSVKVVGTEGVAERECGNGVSIDHGSGWTTQYCHLRQGSLAVRSGQTVAAGDRLGLIGLSGMTEYPHLHFMVRQGERIIDPFDGKGMAEPCGSERESLWRDPWPYTPTGLIAAGFADRQPELEALEQGDFAATAIAANAPALVFWVRIFGVKAGDKLHMRLLAPDGAAVVDSVGDPTDKPKLRVFRSVGIKRTAPTWPVGTYRGEVRLLRQGVAGESVALQTARDLIVR